MATRRLGFLQSQPNDTGDRVRLPGDGGDPLIPPQAPATAPPTAPPPTAPAGAAATTYADMPGWATDRLNNPDDTKEKYQFGRAIQDLGYNKPGMATTENLQKVIDYLNAHGTKVSLKGKDVMDFGNPWPQDAIFDVGGPNASWQYLTAGGDGLAAAPMPGEGGWNPPMPGEGVPGKPPTVDPMSVNGQPFSDPLGGAINDKLLELIQNNGRLGASTEALNLENTRQAADRARRAEVEGVRGTLANRGTLDSGMYQDAVGRIERNDIAPLFSQATRDYLIHGADTANSNLMGALNQGTNRQGMLSDIAIQELNTNVDFQKFLATYGLDRDKALQDLASGNNQQMLGLLMQYFQQAALAAKGKVG